MDVKKKEMDLLSNSIAAYAHIKGKSHSTAQHITFTDPVHGVEKMTLRVSVLQQTLRVLAFTSSSECVSAWCSHSASWSSASPASRGPTCPPPLLRKSS